MAPQAEEPTLVEGTPETLPTENAIVKEQQPEEKTHAESEDGSNEETPEGQATTEDQVTTTGSGFDFSTMCCGGLPSVFSKEEDAQTDEQAEAEKAAKATKIQAVVRGKQARASTEQIKADRESAAKTTETAPIESKPTFMEKLKTLFSGCGKKADTAVVVAEEPKEDAPEAKKEDEEEEKPKKEEESSEEKPTEQPQDV